MKKFVKELLSNSTNVSCKRVSGMGGWVLFCGILLGSFVLSYNMTETQEGLMETLAYTSVLLITGGTLETVFKRNKSNN